jgi:protocatechuate 3,4-dioxygenase beta subunit
MSYKSRALSTVITVAQIFVLSVVLILAHGGAGVRAQGSLAITGTVSNQSGDGVQNVSVYATDPGTSNVDYGPTTTASDGSYELDVEPGSYDLHFDPSSGSGLNNLVDRNVTVSSDQTVDIQLYTAASTYTLSGAVTDSNGNPVPGINVSAASWSH